MQMHPTFYVSLLNPYLRHDETDDSVGELEVEKPHKKRTGEANRTVPFTTSESNFQNFRLQNHPETASGSYGDSLLMP
jgi:hypothetical protein